MSRKPHRRAHFVVAFALLAGVAAWLLVGTKPGWTDDRDLLRFDTAKPYLFLMLDTSASMNLKIGPDRPAVGHMDDPESRIYGAKEALFAVFKDVDDVNFGFATLNQDEGQVTYRHWLYFLDGGPVTGSWPAAELQGWPAAESDGALTAFLVDQDNNGDGTADVADAFPDTAIASGDVLVFGQDLGAQDLDASGADDGTCADPLPIDEPRGRARLNAYAKIGIDGNATTTIHVKTGKGGAARVFELSFNHLGPADSNGNANQLGDDNLRVRFEAQELDPSTCGNKSNGASGNAVFNLRQDAHLNQFIMVDRGVPGGGSGGGATENTAGLWEWQDAVDVAQCGNEHPFTGKGWEGNYDSGVTLAEVNWPEENFDFDRHIFCADPSIPATCQILKPMEDTVLSSYGRPLDRGDMLPFDWLNDNKIAFLQRLAPNWDPLSIDPPNFGVASLLSQDEDAFTAGGATEGGRPPIVATGDTLLGKAINDVRCWYMGTRGDDNGGKCGDNLFFAVDQGWSSVACTYDPDYGCRKPFLVVISDGDDTCAGENPGADVADMKSFTGVTTWALNVGDPKNCQSGGTLHSLTTRTGGECVNVATKQELKKAIQDILGKVREAARAFASAAVPSVQATSDQALYISNFTPLNQKSVWDGHLNAFLKPIPDADKDGKPDLIPVCSSSETSGCFLWDAGTVLKNQYDASDFLDEAAIGKRRVYYAQFRNDGATPWDRRLFDPIDCSASPPAPACLDLLRGMRIQTSDLVAAETEANNVITQTLTLKTHTLTNPDGTTTNLRYLLGDIFHANPTVVGTPVNSQYFALDLESTGDPCEVGDADSNDRGYRCFFARHRFRRKIILAGSNDGMLHAFNAGFYDPSTKKYDNGTGNELWAFIPRAVLPNVKKIAQGTLQQYTVDGTPTVADVFIDPQLDPAPVASERRWRTVAIAGLREGGRAYYAVDITQPDTLNKVGSEFHPSGGTGYLPSCLATACAGSPAPYPTPLWEFTDSTADSILAGAPSVPVAMDEDGNHEADLGDTWSVPGVGRIRICGAGGSLCNPNDPDPANSADLRDMYVAIFGGGMDPDDKESPEHGDWLYMLDVETGKVVYKRRLLAPAGGSGGAAPSQPAAVDTNSDGYIDRIYIGTTGGFMYRVDLAPQASDGMLPRLATVQVRDKDGVLYDAQRIPATDAGGDPVWQPVAIFSANFTKDSSGTVTATPTPRPIYQRPSVIFVAKAGHYALAFGTGDRESLWDKTLEEGRFHVFLDATDDPNFTDTLPLNEGNFQRIGVTDADVTTDFLSDVSLGLGHRGWFLVLQADERVITDSFSLSGVTIFSSFQPDIAIVQGCDPNDPNCETCDPLANPPDPNCKPVTGTCGDKDFESETNNRCAKTGFSRSYVVGTVNANAFIASGTGEVRFESMSTFVTSPFTEPGQNPNPGSSEEESSDTLSLDDIKLLEELKKLFPPGCKFANYRIDVKTIAADTRVERIAPIPVCIIEKNWKEF